MSPAIFGVGATLWLWDILDYCGCGRPTTFVLALPAANYLPMGQFGGAKSARGGIRVGHGSRVVCGTAHNGVLKYYTKYI